MERFKDVLDLAHRESAGWKRRLHELWINGEPTALAGGFAGMEVTPPAYSLPSVTVNATEAAIWPVATWSPIPANIQYPKVYELYAFGTQTTAATPGTVQLVPRIGTTNAGIALGASVTAAQTASETTTAWLIYGRLVVRIGGTATTATAIGSFMYRQGTATTGGSASLPAMDQVFGTTLATFDASVAQGLYMGAVAVTSTTNTFVPQVVLWSSWN